MDLVRTSTRLVHKRQQTEAEPVSTSAVTDAPPPLADGLSPGAKRNRRYRLKLKDDPIRCKYFKEKEADRAKANRAKATPVLKEIQRNATKLRVQKCRQKKKEMGIPLHTPKPMTRAATEEKREKDRVRQQKHRAELKLRPQKRGWITKKKQQQAEAKAAALEQPHEVGSSSTPVDTPVMKAMKVMRKLPADPNLFAEVFEEVVEVAHSSPRKKAALELKFILPQTARKELVYSSAVLEEVGKEYSRLKKSKKLVHSRKRATLGTILLKASDGNIPRIRKKYGISYHFLKKCQTQEFGRKKTCNAMSSDMKKSVEEFYHRGDISRCDPSTAAVSTKTQKPRRYMEKTLKEAYQVFCAEGGAMSFSQFAKLRPTDTKTSLHNKANSCCCEYCADITFKQEAINNFLGAKGLHDLLLPSKYELHSMTLCDKAQNGQHLKLCIDRECGDCGISAIRTRLQPALSEHADTTVSWKKWALVEEDINNRKGVVKTTKKRKVIEKEGSLTGLMAELERELKPFSYHLTNADWQHKQFSQLQKELPQKWALLCMDFAENYQCFYQDEAQGAHWTRDQVTIHPVVVNYHCADGDGVVTESLVFISNDLKHDAHAVQHYQKLAMEELLARGLSFQKIVQFSDGCGSQYKGVTNFVDVSFAKEDLGVETEKHFFGSRHGKGPCDAEIGVIKRLARNAVRARQVQISTAKELFEYCEDRLAKPPLERPGIHLHNRRTFFFVPEGSIPRNRPDRVGSDIKSVQGTRSIHSARGMMPYVLSKRERSCFCVVCRRDEGQCGNAAFCGEWSVAHLKKKTRGPRPKTVSAATTKTRGPRPRTVSAATTKTSRAKPKKRKPATPRPEPSTSTASRPEPSTSAAPQSEPSTSAASRPEPSTSAASRPEPSTSAASRPEPSTSTASRPEPSTSAAPQSEPSTSAAPQSEPSTSAAPQSEPSTAAASRPEPSTAAASRPEPSTSAASRPEPSTSAASRPEPSTSAASRPEPSYAAASRPEPSTAAASQPEPSTAAASRPERSTIAASRPERSTIAASRPEPSTSAASRPEPSISAASRQRPMAPTVNFHEIKAGQYVKIGMSAKKGRKIIVKEFGAVVLQVEDGELEVSYLREKGGKFYFPSVKDIAWVGHADIVRHLAMASIGPRVLH